MSHAPTVSIRSTPDRSMISGSGSCIDLALDARGARDGQRAANAEWRPSALGGRMRRSRPCGADSACIQTGGQVSGGKPPLSCRAFLPLCASRHGNAEPRLLFVPVGSNPARLFGMDARTRACRIAENIGLECADEAAADRDAVLANMAFAWDPAWLREISGRPGTVLTLKGEPVLAHVAGRNAMPPRSTQAMTGQADRSTGFETDRRRDCRAQQFRAAQARAAVRPAARSRQSRSGRARGLRRRLQGRDRHPDALSVAQARVPPDPLGGAGRA